MLEYEVTGRAELAAAVKAAAQPSYEKARLNPVIITLLGTSCRYFFPNGITEGKAERLVTKIARTPSGAFR